MNWRYLYIGSVVALSYILFLSWNAEKEIKQEVAEATAIDQNKNQLSLPLGEDDGFIEIENERLIVKISPESGKVWEARLKEHTYLNNEDSLGVRLFGFDNISGFKFYLNSGFVSEGDEFKVVNTLIFICHKNYFIFLLISYTPVFAGNCLCLVVIFYFNNLRF